MITPDTNKETKVIYDLLMEGDFYDCPCMTLIDKNNKKLITIPLKGARLLENRIVYDDVNQCFKATGTGRFLCFYNRQKPRKMIYKINYYDNPFCLQNPTDYFMKYWILTIENPSIRLV